MLFVDEVLPGVWPVNGVDIVVVVDVEVVV